MRHKDRTHSCVWGMSSDWDVTIEDEATRKSILAIMSDYVSLRLLSQNQVPMSLLMLSKQLNVPIEIVETKVSELLELGLLVMVKSPGSITGLAYRSLIHEVSMRLDPEGISVILRICGSVSPKAARNLLSISRPAT